jgi:hypothetical protein
MDPQHWLWIGIVLMPTVLRIRDVYPGSEFFLDYESRIKKILSFYSSRIQGSKTRLRIPDPDLQHWMPIWIPIQISIFDADP